MLDITKYGDKEFFNRTDRYFCDRPFGWIGGFPFSLFLGQTRITVSGFCTPAGDRADFLMHVISQERCDVVAALPTMLNEFSVRKDKIKGHWPIKTIITGGQPITQRTLACVGENCKYILTAYGGTEFMMASGLVVSQLEEYVDHCSGHAAPGVEVKIVDPDGNIVPPGSSGEIFVRSTSLFREYFNDSEKTAKVRTEDGWYRTDDLGRMLEDGSLFVEGRKSNVIICGGMNVAPEITEDLISRCPGVADVVLVPVPDEVKYQVICACIISAPGSGVDEEMVRKFCKDAHGDKLGLFTVFPEFYLLLDSFPETSTGKVSRKALTSLACKTFGK